MTENPILAIDYGEKRFGLAISDSKGIVATPLEVLEITDRRGVKVIIREILDIIDEYRVKTILLGKPQVFVEGHKKTPKKIERFREKLELETDIPIIYYDESYSTATAQNVLLSLGQNSKSSRGKIDKVAATVFLQEFLNSDNK